MDEKKNNNIATKTKKNNLPPMNLRDILPANGEII